MIGCIDSSVSDGVSGCLGRQMRIGKKTHDWAFLEPEALPPDFPPPVILCFVSVGGIGEK